MIDLAIGTRFYCEGKLCEVVEKQSWCCGECAIRYRDCMILDCEPDSRQDSKKVCFKLVEE